MATLSAQEVIKVVRLVQCGALCLGVFVLGYALGRKDLKLEEATTVLRRELGVSD